MPYFQPRTHIGARRHRIAIQRQVTSDDGMGGQTSVLGWQTIRYAWASVSALDERDKESLAAQQITAKHAYHVDIPYVSGVVPSMRVQWQDKTLEVHTVADDEGRKRRLILQCAEVQ